MIVSIPRMALGSVALVWFALVSLAQTVSAAPDRVALVIGNGAYKNAGALPNPANDAIDVAQALRKLGFDVVEGRDLDKRGMESKILEFGQKLDRANVALFFYAGHGLQVGGKNYLVPTDAKLERAGNLNFEAIDVALVLAQMEADKRVNLVFLDACRDNPLARTFARSLGASRSAAVGQGLASLQSAVGTMIAYATQPDNVALDGSGRNSPFTTALLKHIATPGLEIRSMMTRVRADVLVATRDKQLPWDHSSLIGEVVLVPGSVQLSAPAPAPDEIAWGFLKDTQDANQLRRFIEQYPSSAHRNEAAERLLKLAQLEQARVAALSNAAPPAGGFSRSSSFDPGVVYTSSDDEIKLDRKITSAESCRDLCLVTPSCLLWQFGNAPAVCHLSRSVGFITSTRSPNYFSGRISEQPRAGPAPGSKRIEVNFDALNAFGQVSGIGDKALADYLARFGIKLVASTARFAAFDERNVYEGKAVKASSGRVVLMQQGGNPVSYTLEFATPLKSVSFDRVALIAGPSGITHPIWKATAQDAVGKAVATAGEDEIRSFSDVAAKTFTLTGNNIRKIVVTGDHRGFAAFSSLVLDNLVLVTDQRRTIALRSCCAASGTHVQTLISTSGIFGIAPAANADRSTSR